MSVKRAFVAILALALLSSCTKSPDERAFGWCKTAILAVVQNPTQAIIPRVPGVAETRENGINVYSFQWELKDGLRVRNHFGALNDTGARCIVRRVAPEFQWVDVAGITIQDRSTGYRPLYAVEDKLKAEMKK